MTRLVEQLGAALRACGITTFLSHASLSVDERRRAEQAFAEAREHPCLPDADDKALDGLKFSDALPRQLAEATLSERLADIDGARIVLDEHHRFAR